MEATNETPSPGDRIVFARADGLLDVVAISVSGGEETRRAGLLTIDSAYEIARGSLDGGELWWRHHSKPSVTERYKIQR